MRRNYVRNHIDGRQELHPRRRSRPERRHRHHRQVSGSAHSVRANCAMVKVKGQMSGSKVKSQGQRSRRVSTDSEDFLTCEGRMCATCDSLVRVSHFLGLTCAAGKNKLRQCDEDCFCSQIVRQLDLPSLTQIFITSSR